MSYSRRKLSAAAALLAMSIATSGVFAAAADDAIIDKLETALRDKKSVTVYIDGHALGGRVVRIIEKDAVELGSYELGKILVRINRINAVAGN